MARVSRRGKDTRFGVQGSYRIGCPVLNDVLCRLGQDGDTVRGGGSVLPPALAELGRGTLGGGWDAGKKLRAGHPPTYLKNAIL